MASDKRYTLNMTMIPVQKIIRGTELPNGEVFINMRPASTPGKVVVRLFHGDKIVTRLWNSNATVEL